MGVSLGFRLGSNMVKSRIRRMRSWQPGNKQGFDCLIRIMTTKHICLTIIATLCFISIFLTVSQLPGDMFKTRFVRVFDKTSRLTEHFRFTGVDETQDYNNFQQSESTLKNTNAAKYQPLDESTSVTKQLSEVRDWNPPKKLDKALNILAGKLHTTQNPRPVNVDPLQNNAIPHKPKNLVEAAIKKLQRAKQDSNGSELAKLAPDSIRSASLEKPKNMDKMRSNLFANDSANLDDTDKEYVDPMSRKSKIEPRESDVVDPKRLSYVRSVTRYADMYRRKFQHYYNASINLLPEQTKGVIIVTNYRSGSTFLGELFNYHSDAFYTFEPLYPFTGTCDEQNLAKVQHLHRLLKCDVPDVSDLYRTMKGPLRKSHVDVECLINNFCFRQKTAQLCGRDLCPFGTNCKRCGPLHLPRVMNLCRHNKISVIKVIRLCDIGQLKSIMDDPFMDLKVIHLVRDPRGILSSRLKINKKWPLVESSVNTCDRLRSNALAGLANTTRTKWLKGRYLRIRYEDLALQPFLFAEKIYEFAGLDFQPQIKSWIRKNTGSGASRNPMGVKKDPYSTRRDSAAAMQGWRTHLTFEQVNSIQRQCGDVLDLFGYTRVKSRDELLDFSRYLLV